MHDPAPTRCRPFVVPLGLLLVLVLAPLSQLLTILTTNSAAETAAPAAWAVGLLATLVAAVLLVRVTGRWVLLAKAELALLYGMLAMAVPLLNLGLVRPVFLSQVSVLRDYLMEGTSTYRTAYGALEEVAFPVIPTEEATAWLGAERLLRLLEDAPARQTRREALQQLELALSDRPVPTAEARPDAPAWAAWIAGLGLDEIEQLRARRLEEKLAARGWGPLLEEREREAAAASRTARQFLESFLPQTDEWVASLLPDNLAALDPSARRRLDTERNRLAPDAQAELEQRVAELAARESEVRQAVGRLSGSDWLAVRDGLIAHLRARQAGLAPAAAKSTRDSLVFRLSREERRILFRRDGREWPNQNLWAFHRGLWEQPAERLQFQQMGWLEIFQATFRHLPWAIWARPLLFWGALLTAIYLWFWCLAEWLRPRWVEGENLPFPLVEVVDHLIRHDYRLELAGDLRDPEPRQRLFYPLFTVGLLAGLAWLGLEALSHYGYLPKGLVPMLNLNEKVFDFAGGGIKEIGPVVFVLSPLVIGVAYFLSLETSFSIWCTFLVYTLVVWAVRLSLPEIKDSEYTGFEGGKNYPFAMEQLLGASLCYAAYYLGKSVLAWREARRRPAPADPAARAAAWARPGLALLPVVIGALLWVAGVRHLGLLALAGLVTVALTVAMARLRAETGLPSDHVHYELTKLPMIAGLTGSTGAGVFAAFTNFALLPGTLLFRTLSQHLDNFELARRHRLPAARMARAGAAAALAAVLAGGFSFLIFSYIFGETFHGNPANPPQGNPTTTGLATYGLWVSHFLGEPGLDQFTRINWLRWGTVGLGFSLCGLLLWARRRFLGFPLHPVGYLVILASTYFNWCTLYVNHTNQTWETTTLWGGVLAAWIIKSAVSRYGGIITYKRSKPLFAGLVIGGLLAIFLWNAIDLAVSAYALRGAEVPVFLKPLLEYTPYTPALY